jgi:hypothetical protein
MKKGAPKSTFFSIIHYAGKDINFKFLITSGLKQRDQPALPSEQPAG